MPILLLVLRLLNELFCGGRDADAAGFIGPLALAAAGADADADGPFRPFPAPLTLPPPPPPALVSAPPLR